MHVVCSRETDAKVISMWTGSACRYTLQYIWAWLKIKIYLFPIVFNLEYAIIWTVWCVKTLIICKQSNNRELLCSITRVPIYTRGESFCIVVICILHLSPAHSHTCSASHIFSFVSLKICAVVCLLLFFFFSCWIAFATFALMRIKILLADQITNHAKKTWKIPSFWKENVTVSEEMMAFFYMPCSVASAESLLLFLYGVHLFI